MTDQFRAMCAELVDALDSGIPAGRIRMSPLADRARALLDQPVAKRPTLMERAMNGDATAAKQFLHEAGFTDKQGQWLPQYQPIPEAP